MAHDQINLFCEAFAKVAGRPHVARDVVDAAATAAAIAADHGAGSVALANLPAPWAEAIAGACAAQGQHVLRAPFDGPEIPRRIDGAAVGITGMAFAIAQTGTLVEVTDNDADRLVSALPRVHIGVVSAADLVAAYADAAAPLREILRDVERPRTVSFISGPSRTGDIELKLTLGVHGPEVAHAIVIA